MRTWSSVLLRLFREHGALSLLVSSLRSASSDHAGIPFSCESPPVPRARTQNWMGHDDGHISGELPTPLP